MPTTFEQERNIKLAIKELEKNEIKKDPNIEEISYLQGLNESQKLAATRKEGNYLVLAGPGAGKTHTLIYRIIHMIKSGVPAHELCVVTFTRKAANELKYRVKQLIPEIELGFVGTIHSLAYTLIRRGVNNAPRLIDPEDDVMVLKLVINEGNFNLPPRIQTKTIQKIFDYKALTLKSMKETLISLNREEFNAEDLEKILQAYTKYKLDNGYITYSDGIALAEGMDRGYLNYLMIDEFQDTDPLQLSMLKSLEFPNVMAIGDDFQSIYSFRGADNTIILEFGEHFSNAKVVKLDINYRSTQEIVDLENIITNHSDFGYKKDLKSFKGKLNKPVKYFDYDTDKLDQIIKRIDSIKDNHKKKIAVIYRYNRSKSPIEAVLIQKKINYVVYGGIRLLARKHIKDVFAMMLVNKNKNDFIPYMRSLTLIDGIGEVTAKKLIQNNLVSEKREVKQLKKILFKEYEDILKLIKDIEEFYLTLESVLKKANYTVEEIKEDFELIRDLAKNYSSITNFISDIILDGSLDKWSSKDKKANVVLTTIHSSKGLEFDEVHFLYDPDPGYGLTKLEENRRLFYTAISRAKEDLYIYDSWGRTNIDEILKDFSNDLHIPYNTDLSRYQSENKKQITDNEYIKKERKKVTKKSDDNKIILKVEDKTQKPAEKVNFLSELNKLTKDFQKNKNKALKQGKGIFKSFKNLFKK